MGKKGGSGIKTYTTQSGNTVASNQTLTKAQTKALQQGLVAAGYSVGSSGVDGVYGKDTAAAVAAWKKDNGINNTAGYTIGLSNYNKITGGSSGGSNKSGSSGSSGGSNKSGSSGSSGSSSKTYTPYSGSYKAGGTNKAVTQDALIQAYKTKTDETKANWEAKGKKVYSGIDQYGVEHVTTLGNDRLNEILNYYNSQDTPVYGVGNTNYYIGSTPAVVKSVTSSMGNRNANVTYYADGSVDVTYDNSNGAATPTVGDYITESDGTYLFYVEDDDYGSYWAKGTPEQYNNYVQEYEANIAWQQYQAEIAAREAEELEAIQAANQAAVDKNVLEIEAELENGTGQYDQDAAEAYLQKLKGQQTQQLQNAYQGDLGGIGTKQYSDVTANYDQQMLQIALEKENFVNSCNQQINQLKAEGRLQDAEILSEWAQAKIDRYEEDYKWYEELKLSKAAQELNEDELQLSRDQLSAEIENADREYYYNRAVAMLEKGGLTSDALEVLGVSSDWASKYADQINSTAAISLSYAKAQLDALVAETNAVKSSTSSSGSYTYSPSGSVVERSGNEKKKGDNGGNSGGGNGTITIYHATGTQTVVELEDDGSIPASALKKGDYILNDDGTKLKYDPSAGDFKEDTGSTYSLQEWLKAYKSLTGDAKGSSVGLAYSKLTAMFNDAVEKRDEYKAKIENGNYSSMSGGKNKTDSTTTKAGLLKMYNKYDTLAGTYKTLLNKYPG